MIKFSIVKEAPAELGKNEYLIDTPNFMPEIALHKTKAGKGNITAPHHLRSILGSIASAYDPENMSAYSARVHLYDGRPYKNDTELNQIFLEMLHLDYPVIFDKYLNKKINDRPEKTELIIYVKNPWTTFLINTFYKYGFVDIVDCDANGNKKVKKT